MDDVKPLAVSLSTAGQLLSMHPRTLKRMCAHREIPARKVGRAWKIRMSDLEALIAPTKEGARME